MIDSDSFAAPSKGTSAWPDDLLVRPSAWELTAMLTRAELCNRLRRCLPFVLPNVYQVALPGLPWDAPGVVAREALATGAVR